MDILRPPIVRIGNRCYRKNPVLQRDHDTAEDDVTDFMPDEAGWNDESCTLDCTNIEKTSDGYRTVIPTPSTLFKFIIGKKGETKRRLETETRTQIRIPKQGQEGDIVIVGHERNGVVSAKTRIDVLLDSGRQKHPFTHFLSVPLTARHIQGNLADFKADILRECDGDRGLDASIFQDPCKTHLTFGCLVLLDDAEIQRAVTVLNDCKEDLVRPILKGHQLMVSVRGLEYMNDDPAEVDVLYAKIDDRSERLQILADRLVDKFAAAGLLQREYDHVKLHATVMNTLFRRDPSGTSEPARRNERGGKERESFNANNVLKRFGNYKFGDYLVDSFHISTRHSFGQDGYYTCAGSIGLT